MKRFLYKNCDSKCFTELNDVTETCDWEKSLKPVCAFKNQLCIMESKNTLGRT